MSKWPNNAKLLERAADDGQGLSSRQIAEPLKAWCETHPDLEPSKVRIWVQAYSATDATPNEPTASNDLLNEWLKPKVLTDGVCYFAFSDELEGYPIKVMRLFRKGKQFAVLFDLLDFVPWDEDEEDKG